MPPKPVRSDGNPCRSSASCIGKVCIDRAELFPVCTVAGDASGRGLACRHDPPHSRSACCCCCSSSAAGSTFICCRRCRRPRAGSRCRAQRPRSDRARRRRGPADHRPRRRRRRLWARLCACPGSAVPDGDCSAATAPAGSPRYSGPGARQRPADARPRPLSRCRSRVPVPVAEGPARARSLCRRGQRLSRVAPRRLAARISAAALCPRAVAAGGQSRLGQADGAASSAATTAANCCAPGWPAPSRPTDLALLYPEYPKDAPTTLADMPPIYRRLALDLLYAALPPVGRADLRLEQLGRRRRAQRQRQAAARQRSAPRLRRAGLLVSRPTKDAGARDRRRHRPRQCRLSWSATTTGSPGVYDDRRPMSRISSSRRSTRPIPAAI